MVLEPIHSIFVQACNLVPYILWDIFGSAQGGRDVGKEETDSLDKCATYNKLRVEVPVSDWHS